MKYIGRNLLTLLISFFILNSCKNPDDNGLDLIPADQISSILVDTSTVRAVTIREDTLITTGLLQHPLGYLQDPQIGTTEANLAIALNLPSPGLKFGKTAVLDSAILVLNYGKEFYGSSGLPFIINVYQLNEKIKPNIAYYNTKTWSFNPTIIGSRTVNSFPLNDSLRLTDIVVGKADTIRKAPPQLRIPINSSFINSNFLKADSSKFSDNVRFNNFINGLYVTIDHSNNANGIVFFNLASGGKNGLDLYIKTPNGSIIDTTFLHFGITKDSTAATIKHTYSTAIQTQLNNPTQQFSTVYTQPMGGLRTKINFPFINSLKALGKIIINKAELVVTLEGSSNILYGASPRLILYRTDIADQRQPVPDNNSGQTLNVNADPRVLDPTLFGGYYDMINKRYKFVITSYIQDILSGKLTQYNTYIAPVYTDNSLSSQILSSATGSTAARSILGGGNSGNYRMKLNIIYTRLK